MIREIQTQDIDRVVSLNASEVQWTSPMNADQLCRLLGFATYKKVLVQDDQIAGFLLAIRAGANYVNQNFDWFANRYNNFMYVDRIVIDHSFAGRGLGRIFYTDMFSFAVDNGCESVVCEYSSRPLNKLSKVFHTTMGFNEVGTQQLETSAKLVSMQSKPL